MNETEFGLGFLVSLFVRLSPDSLLSPHILPLQKRWKSCLRPATGRKV